ncbi:hypothetical protein AVEN_197502-1 [Araneus ventricosus]|uniref:Uncharacterized protein n=1 Tax=Araneus ventricosus TaxID=182803 RepID=A0A4Y2BTN2_ARAVE|nr:hypothetical protein AVEN_197502-1 [Araneus ventricosus]
MGFVKQEDNTITQHARAFTLDGFTMASNNFLLPKLKEHLSGKRFCSDSDVKTSAENCGHDFYQAALNKLVLQSVRCRNRFGGYVEK